MTSMAECNGKMQLAD